MYIGIGIVVILLLLLFLWASKPGKSQLQTHRKQMKSATSSTKPVVMIILDSLMEKPLQDAIQSGEAPALRFFTEQGKLIPNMVTCFPTMSVCIDSTLLTGKPPNQHHIYGLSYYHPGEKRIINFGTGAKEAFSVGLKQVLTDSVLNLNQRFLNPKTPTIHETFSGSTASINAFVYRGRKKYQLQIPRFLHFLGLLPKKVKTMGPKIFSLGSLQKLDEQTGYDQIWHRYGENDRFSTDELIALMSQQTLPPFTIVYFPTNDDYVHQKGVAETKGIKKADQSLQKILNCFPSWKEAIDQITWIILGDSGQTDTIPDHKQAFIDMKKLLHTYHLTSVKSGKPTKHDQITCCVNERMSYLYLHDDQVSLDQVARQLQKDQRIDLIAWKEHDIFHVISGSIEGHLQFSANGELIDEYDQSWTVKGNLAILNLTVEQNRLTYGNYPDALFRLQSVSETADRVIMTTAAPGYEMVLDTSPKHTGASHGSLHYMDSLVPMIIAGTDSRPKYPRVIDLKSWILSLLKK